MICLSDGFVCWFVCFIVCFGCWVGWVAGWLGVGQWVVGRSWYHPEAHSKLLIKLPLLIWKCIFISSIYCITNNDDDNELWIWPLLNKLYSER